MSTRLLSEGDRVILVATLYGDNPSNPLWKGSQGCTIGTVTKGDGVITSVKWDNGSSNVYHPSDLHEHKQITINVTFNGKPGKVVCVLTQNNYIVNFGEDMQGFSCDGKYKKGSCLILNKADVEEVKTQEN